MTTEEQPPEEPRPETGEANPESAETGDDDTLPRLIAALTEQVGEIRGQLERLLNVQFDRLRLRARSGFFWFLSALLFGAVCVVATAAAVLYLLEGIAGFFTALFDGNTWAGDLSAGAGVLLLVLLAILIFARGFRKKELKRLKRKYESDSAKGEAG